MALIIYYESFKEQEAADSTYKNLMRMAVL